MSAATSRVVERSSAALAHRAWSVWAGGLGGLDAVLRCGVGDILRANENSWFERWASQEGVHLRLYDLPGGEETGESLRRAIHAAQTSDDFSALLPPPSSWERSDGRYDVEPLAAAETTEPDQDRAFLAVSSRVALETLARTPRGAERVSFGLLVCERLLAAVNTDDDPARVLDAIAAAALGPSHSDAASVRQHLEHEAGLLGGPLRAVASQLAAQPWAQASLDKLGAALDPARVDAGVRGRLIHGALNRLGILPLEEVLLCIVLSPSSSLVRVRSVSKSYGERSALEDIDLEVEPGEVFGLLGPPGAGKTTLLGVVCGLRVPDAGRVEVDGHEPARSPRELTMTVGQVPADHDLGPGATPRETLVAYGRVAEHARPVDEILGELGLTEVAGQVVGELAAGQRRRLAIGCALLSEPQLLVIDEPTGGLGPTEREEVWDLVRSRPVGSSVLLATDNPLEALELCDRVAVIRGGRVLAVGDPSELVDEHFPEQVCRFETDEEPDRARLEDIPEASSVRVEVHAGFWIVEALTRRPDALVALVNEDPELPRVTRMLETASSS